MESELGVQNSILAHETIRGVSESCLRRKPGYVRTQMYVSVCVYEDSNCFVCKSPQNRVREYRRVVEPCLVQVRVWVPSPVLKQKVKKNPQNDMHTS